MLCQHCQRTEANVHFTQVINNNKVEMYLCQQCAGEKGKMNLGSPISINDFFSGLIGFEQREPYLTSIPQKVVCEKCGMSYEEFQKTGKLGCSNCYSIYSDKLKGILKRIHGNAKHQGKMPARISYSTKANKEIENLKTLLKKAIQSEEYEKAAELRDKIRNLEANSNNIK